MISVSSRLCQYSERECKALRILLNRYWYSILFMKTQALLYYLQKRKSYADLVMGFCFIINFEMEELKIVKQDLSAIEY